MTREWILGYRERWLLAYKRLPAAANRSCYGSITRAVMPVSATRDSRVTRRWLTFIVFCGGGWAARVSSPSDSMCLVPLAAAPAVNTACTVTSPGFGRRLQVIVNARGATVAGIPLGMYRKSSWREPEEGRRLLHSRLAAQSVSGVQ